MLNQIFLHRAEKLVLLAITRGISNPSTVLRTGIEQGIMKIEVEVRDILRDKNSYLGVKVFTQCGIRNTHHEIRVRL